MCCLGGALVQPSERGEKRMEGFSIASPKRDYVARYYAIIGGGAAGSAVELVDLVEVSSGKTIRVAEMAYTYDICLHWKGNAELELIHPGEGWVKIANDRPTFGRDTAVTISVHATTEPAKSVGGTPNSKCGSLSDL